MQQIDIGEMITSHLTKQPDRKDHGGISVSDISNGCTRAVWHRIHRGIRKEFDGTTRKKFEYGYALEKVVEKSLIANDYEVLPDSVVIFNNGKPDERFIPERWFDMNPSEWAKATDIVGHPDIVARKKPVDVDTEPLVIEVKSTMLFRNGNQPPQHGTIDDIRRTNANYILQGVAYAKAVGASTFLVYVSDRGTGQDATYTFSTEAEWPAFKERMEHFSAVCMNPDVEPEPDLPEWTRNARGQSYLCKGCPVVTCRNRR